MIHLSSCFIILSFCLVLKGSSPLNIPNNPDCTEGLKLSTVQFQYMSKYHQNRGFMYPVQRLDGAKISIQEKIKGNSNYCWRLDDCGKGLTCITPLLNTAINSRSSTSSKPRQKLGNGYIANIKYHKRGPYIDCDYDCDYYDCDYDCFPVVDYSLQLYFLNGKISQRYHLTIACKNYLEYFKIGIK